MAEEVGRLRGFKPTMHGEANIVRLALLRRAGGTERKHDAHKKLK